VSETILRQLKLLEILPREPYKLSPEKIWSLIEDHGFNSSLRTIQRDLRDLSAILPIVCDDRSKPYGWSWHRNSSGLNPAMDPIEALTFSLAESYLKPLMPNKNFNRLKIFFDRANNVLENMDKSSIKRWRQNVRVVPQWQTLIPPEIDEEVESVIYDALLNANKLRVLYLRRGDTKPSCRIINPLGIVLQGVVLRLICTMDDTPEDLRHLPIHRFKSATIFNTKISKPKKFDLDKFIEDQNIGYLLSNKPLQL
jgi:predicted DNA-binding transcriptional regulator YafY